MFVIPGQSSQDLSVLLQLDDANEAGGKNGYKCTLIITEGDSAKALAVSGLSGELLAVVCFEPFASRYALSWWLTVIGRDHYGVFPLRGKLLNVRDANHSVRVPNCCLSSCAPRAIAFFFVDNYGKQGNLRVEADSGPAAE